MRTQPWVIWMTLDMVCWVATLALASNGYTRAAIGFGIVGIALAVIAGVAEEKARRLRRSGIKR